MGFNSMLGISIIFCFVFSLRVHLSTYPQASGAGGGGERVHLAACKESNQTLGYKWSLLSG